MEKEHENPPGNFFSVLPIMHGIDLLFSKIQISFHY